MPLADDFAQHLRAFRRPRTVDIYKYAVLKFEAFIGDQPPGANCLEQFARHLVEAGMAPTSVNLLLVGVRQYLAWRKRNGEALPEFYQAPISRSRPKVRSVLRDQALAGYMEAASKRPEPYRTALLILPLTGLRVGELCTIRKGDLRSTPRYWIITVRDGKGGDREVPVLDPGNALLTAYLRDVRKTLPGINLDRPYIFPGRDGGPMQPVTLRDHMGKVRLVLGMRKLNPHLLRHTFITLCHEHGIDAFDLARIAGHKSLNTTKLYVQANVPRIARQMERIPFPWTPTRPASAPPPPK